MVASLVNRAHAICDSEHLKGELKQVDEALKGNGYSAKLRSWKPKVNHKAAHINTEKRAFLPYFSTVADKIRRKLNRYGVKTIFRPPRKIKQWLRSPKDHIPLSKPGVYGFPCDCGVMYIGETKRSISVRLKEHMKAVQKMQVNKSAVAEHLAYNAGHEIHFHKAKCLATERFRTPRIVREAIEIKRHSNFNRDQSFPLSPSWEPVLHDIRKIKNAKQSDTISIVCRDANMLNNNNNNNTCNAEQQHSSQYNLRSRKNQQPVNV